MRLSEHLRSWRAERPDEWKMDEFIRKAEAMESALKELGNASDLVSRGLNIIQPFLEVWKKHGEIIEEVRDI